MLTMKNSTIGGMGGGPGVHHAGKGGRAFRLGCILTCMVSLAFPSVSGALESMDSRDAGWRISEYAISPNGESLAEVVTRWKSGVRREEVSIRKVNGRQPRKVIYSANVIHDLVWLDKRKISFVVPGRNGGIFEEKIDSGRLVKVVGDGTGISNLTVDRRSGCLGYEVTEPWSWGARVSLRVPNTTGTGQLALPKGLNGLSSTVVRVVRPGGGRCASINARFERLGSGSFLAPKIAWREGKLLIWTTSLASFRTRIADAASGKVITAKTPLYRTELLAVSPAGRIAVTALGGMWKGQKDCGCSAWPERLYVLGKGSVVHRIGGLAGQFTGLWWAGRDRILAQLIPAESGTLMAEQYSELALVNWRTGKIIRTFRRRGGDLGDPEQTCSVDRRATEAICVAQTLTTPPMLVRENLSTGVLTPIGRLRSGQAKLDFGFRTVEVGNRFGWMSKGFLALPSATQGRAVPLAVMLYGFDKQYSRDAQWITSYPVARFVHAGIAVLLLNFAYDPKHLPPGFAGSRIWLESAVSTATNAVAAVRATGVKISRAMVMGWSWGGVVAAHAIQESHAYVAAQVGDPAQYTVTGYALGGDFFRNYLGHIFGGPPNRRNIEHYLEFDPAADGRAAHGPILLEYVSRYNPDVGQLLGEWLGDGTDVEAFAYHNSVHWLNVPAEARISRERNLDWAELNLFGPQSVSVSKLRQLKLSVPRTGWWRRPEKVGGETR